MNNVNCLSKSQNSHTHSLLNTSHCNSFGVLCSLTQKRCQKMLDGKVLSKLIGLDLLLRHK